MAWLTAWFVSLFYQSPKYQINDRIVCYGYTLKIVGISSYYEVEGLNFKDKIYFTEAEDYCYEQN